MIGIWLLVPLVLLIHFVLLLSTQFTLWPEMVVYPYLINNGFVLYREIINPYPPIFTSLLAVFAKVFGYAPLPYQVLTWFLILITDFSIFAITKRLFKNYGFALLAILFFSILSLPFSINGLWFDLVQTPLVLLAIYHFYILLVQKKFLRKRLFFAFFFLTIAFFIKQQIIWLFFLFAVLFIRRFGKNSYGLLLRNYIIILPFLFLLIFQVIIFWQKNLLSEFLFWNFYFPFIKASQMSGYLELPSLRQILVVFSLFLIFLPIVFSKNQARLIILLAAAALLFASPRFDFFHLITSLAILSLVFGPNLQMLSKSKFQLKPIVVLSLLFLGVFTVRYLVNNWDKEVRFFEKDIFQTAQFIGKLVPQGKPVYIQNGPDQLLPLSQRLPPKPWADEFPWYLELPEMQEKVVSAIHLTKPKFIIFKPYEQKDKYAIGSYRPEKISDYIDLNYREFLQISDTLWLKIIE